MRPTVVILCGGRGTRLREGAPVLAKPLVEIGGRPILWHVIQIFRFQGFSRFLLLTGYRRAQIEEFAACEPWPEGVRVRCLDTGEDTPTGGRLRRALAALDTDPVCVTYADGVADLDLEQLLACHATHGAQATMTVVRPRLQFGVAELNGDGMVSGFTEKPVSDHWVNGGFFCLARSAIAAFAEDSILEREPLERLAAAGQLRAFRHRGFWACVDTYKDALELDDLWSHGRAPWKLWG